MKSCCLIQHANAIFYACLELNLLYLHSKFKVSLPDIFVDLSTKKNKNLFIKKATKSFLISFELFWAKRKSKKKKKYAKS